MIILRALLLCTLLNTNAVDAQAHKPVAEVAKSYFDTYSKRKDFERFMTFYSDKAQFVDVIYGNNLKTKLKLKHF